MLGYLCDSELKHTESLLTFVFVFVFLWHFSLELRLIAENSLMKLFSTSTTKLNVPHFDVWKAAKWKEHIVSYDASLGSVVNVGDFFFGEGFSSHLHEISHILTCKW